MLPGDRLSAAETLALEPAEASDILPEGTRRPPPPRISRA
jgi:hypothetical protein